MKKRGNGSAASASPAPALTPRECIVLGIFRDFLMVAGSMLCLNKADVDTHKIPLAGLTAKGLLVKESRAGGYSLTEAGFVAMRNAG